MHDSFKGKAQPSHVATTNACKLCTPLGASMVFHGIEGGMCLLHGSQGCSTYIRRYLISHFKEPLDVASSNFSESSAVYGGWDNLRKALENLERAYKPELIGIATTCLAETMGEDVPAMIKRVYSQWKEADAGQKHPILVSVSTPSYKGTHAEGFQAAVTALVEALAGTSESGSINEKRVNLFPGMVSPGDLRALKDLCESFDLKYSLVGDYSDTLDGGVWDEYHALPPGGTPLEDIRRCDKSLISLELGGTLNQRSDTAAAYLEQEFAVPRLSLGWPVGIAASDAFMSALSAASGKAIPEKQLKARNRLIDAYADAHKVIFGQRVLIYGEADLALALALFADEIGMVPALVATGAYMKLDSKGKEQSSLEDRLRQAIPDFDEKGIRVMEGADFIDMELAAQDMNLDMILGHSKGFKLSRAKGIPLMRLGFPVHDRFGGARIRLLGYEGTQDLFDNLVNMVLEKRQNDNPVGYTYY